MNETTIIAVGELLVEFISHRKGCALRELAEYTGPYASGAPAICIDQAARMGAQTTLFGGLGSDNFGNVLTDRLQASGVDTSSVLRLENKTTGVAFVSYYDDGSRTFIFHLNDTAADAIADTEFVLPEGALLLHVSGASLGNASLRVAIESIASQVRERGGKISCDPNARAELMRDQEGRDMLFRMMQECSYLFPSTSDLEFLFPGNSEEESIDQLLSYGAEILALKRGSQGAVIVCNQDRFVFSGHKVQEVDPTGAGDAFCGTFLAMITQGHSAESAGRYANAAGALAVTRCGPMEGNSDRESIEQFLQAKS